MPRYLMLAINGPTGGEGDAATLDRWYEETHLPDFKAVEGVKTARRYKILRGHVPGLSHDLWPNVTAYEIETDDMAAVSAQLAKLPPFDATLDRTRSAHLLCIQIAGDA
jgi:hypothetical protein